MGAPVHTQFAMAAIDLATVFNAVVGNTPLASTDGPTFAIELSAPDGPSTGGGTQSLQHIRLVREGLTIVAGSIDAVQKTAELRSHAFASSLHATRYKGAALPVDRKEYEGMLKRVREFVATQSYSTVLKDAAPVPVAARPASGGAGTMIMAILLVAAIAGGAYYYVVVMHR